MVEVIQKCLPEPLYLQRDSTNEIFINDCHLLKQHQIDGLRFLFKQYKKKKHGVIVNFPSHCGKTVTVVLFLHAVRNLLKKPVLILCKHVDEMDIWKEYFSKWSDFNEDVVVESPKLLKGKKIFIKQTTHLASYQQHSWSIVIAKDDLINKEMCQITNADYKIWITSTDMKKDRAMLAFIYKWMYPKLEFNMKDFTSTKQKPKEMLIKSTYLSTFLEDFVIREDDIKQFETTKISVTSNAVNNNQMTENKLKKSRKNKDETGSKIKRSRRIIEDDEENIIKNTVMTTDSHVNTEEFVVNRSDRHNEVKVNNISNNLSDNFTNIDDISVIPNTSEYHRQYLDKNVSADNTSHIEIKMEVDSTEQMNFRDAVNEIVKNENIQTENSTESLDSYNGSDINIVVESNKKTMDVDENVINKHGFSYNSVSVAQIEENVDVVEEKCMHVVDNVDATDTETENGSVKCHNTIETKLSELEENIEKV